MKRYAIHDSLKMDRRITIILVVVLAVLGGYIWYAFLREDAPPIEPVTPAPTPIAVLEFDDSQAMALQVRDVKNNQTTRVVREGDAWKMEQPAQGQAFAPPIERLLFALAALKAERKIASPTDLAAYGLNPPAYQVQVTMQDGSGYTLALGNQNPDKSYFYAMKNSDAAVYLITASIGEDIQALVTSPPYTPTPALMPQATPTP